MPRGFMIFELMVVIALILVCSLIGFMSYQEFKGTSCITDIAILSLLLRTAAARAVCLNREQQIIIDEANSLVQYDGHSYYLQKGCSFGVLPQVYGPPSSPHKLVTQAVTFVDKKIVAHRDGSLQAGTLYITDSQQQYALTTPVSAFSHIRAYRYDMHVWQSF